MSILHNPLYQNLKERLQTYLNKGAEPEVEKFNLFLEEIQRMLKTQHFNPEYIYQYVQQNAAYLQNHFLAPISIHEFFHERLSLNYQESVIFENNPISFERLENVQKLFSLMIEYRVMPDTKKECALGFIEHIFHQASKGKKDGFCGNNGEDFFIENTFIAFSHFIDFCAKEKIELTPDHKTKIQNHLLRIFLIHWSGNIYEENDEGVLNLDLDKVKLGQEIVRIYFDHILLANYEEINKFKERLQEKYTSDNDIPTPVQEFILPFIEHYVLDQEVVVKPKSSNSFFKI